MEIDNIAKADLQRMILRVLRNGPTRYGDLVERMADLGCPINMQAERRIRAALREMRSSGLLFLLDSWWGIDSRWITPNAAASQLGVTRSAISDRMRRSTLRYIKIGGSYLVDSTDLARVSKGGRPRKGGSS